MRMRRAVWGGLLFLVIASLGLAASNAEMYFASDKNGQNRVTNVQEGTSVWIVIHDPDENIDCDVRDKFWTDAKVFDPKTGAYCNWSFAPERGVPGIGALGAKNGAIVPVEAYGWYLPGHYPDEDVPADIVYFEETGADTGLFVSSHPMQIGTRLDYQTDYLNTHWVGLDFAGIAVSFGFYGSGFNGNVGQWEYVNGLRVPFPEAIPSAVTLPNWVVSVQGRFENMDTLIGMVVDQNDPTDVAMAMMKIIDTEATITFDQEIYKDANGSATITVVDADENLNCNEVEYVPVFILVNPGSWNPVDGKPWTGQGGRSPTNFCMLKRSGGVEGPPLMDGGIAEVGNSPMRWYNIYNAVANAYGDHGAKDGRYYIQYPTQHGSPWNVVYFDTVNPDGLTAVSFYAQETGANTGVFQLNLNSILDDLGFNSLEVRDVLAAYYLDPNDEDDFKLDAAYIEEKMHSITSFTDANRQDKEVYWLGRDPVYVQVIDANANVDSCCPEQVVVLICDVHEEDDAEWIILDETSSNSPVFFTNVGYELRPVWDAMGVGEGFFAAPAGVRPRQGGSLLGGYQLVLDNWKIEAFNEDDIFAQYNDAYYGAPPYVYQSAMGNDVSDGLAGLGDSDTSTSFPPLITNGPIANVAGSVVSERSIGGSPGIRVPNDVSFDLMSIGDTQVYNGQTVNMYFLDRQGSRVSGYLNSDCVFIEVVDPDQNEDTLRRERIDAFWDGGQNLPFGPMNLNAFECDWTRDHINGVNALLGDTNIFNNSPGVVTTNGVARPAQFVVLTHGSPKVYVLNPRSGQWAALDLLESGVTTGDFVSVICVDLVNVTACVPTLGALPGDTVVAFYQDPSNHSDSAMIQVKVGIGGGTTPASQTSATAFTNAAGVAVQNYTDADLVYVRVVDPSHVGAAVLRNAVTILGVAYDLLPIGGAGCRDDNMPPLPPVVGDDVFITVGLDLSLAAGTSITATYKDPNDPNDTSSDTITVIASKLDVTSFYAGPSPSAGDVTFGYKGSGMASVMSVEVYDLAGHCVWASELANVTQIVWSQAAGDRAAANGCYIYLVTATDGTETFNGKGTVFISR